GREQLEAVKTLRTVSEAEIQGMAITIEQLVDKEKGVAVQNTMLGGQVLSKVRITKDKVTVSAQGQSQEVPDNEAAAYQMLLNIFPELVYQENGITLELDGVVQLDGEEAYQINVTQGNLTSTEYYSVASGLKLKNSSELSGEVTIENYGTYEGLQFPETITIINPAMPVPLMAVTKEVIIKGEISEDKLR